MSLPSIAIAGRFQVGKSTLLNCLLQKKYSKTGNGCATTRRCLYFRYGISLFPRFRRIRKIRHPLLRKVTLIDTPGFGVDEVHDKTAGQAIRQSDAVLLVLAEKTLHEQDRAILELCRKHGKQVIALFNCKGEPDDSRIICNELNAQLKRDYSDLILPYGGRMVFPCNLLWAWIGLSHKKKKRRKNDDPFMSDTDLVRASGIWDILQKHLPLHLMEIGRQTPLE